MTAYRRGTTMTQAEIERKVRQLDNDVQSVHELLRSISATQTRHGNRLDSLDGKVDSLRLKFGTLDGNVDEVLALLRER